jgi:hypothetical protein
MSGDQSFSVEQFEQFARKRMGRAYLALVESVADEYKKIILLAAEKDQRFDWQFEEEPSGFFVTLAKRAGIEKELYQQCVSTRRESERDETLRLRIISKFLDIEPTSLQILQQEALNAQIEATEILVKSGYLDWVLINVMDSIPKGEKYRFQWWKDEYPDISAEAALKLNEAIEMFQASHPQKVTKKPQLARKYETALKKVKSGKARTNELRRLAPKLTPEQITEVARLWIEEQDFRIGTRYMKLLEVTGFPLPVSELISAIRSGKSPARFYEILGKIQDPYVIEFGFELMDHTPPDYRGIRILLDSIPKERLPEVEKRLLSFPLEDLEEIHSLCLDILATTKDCQVKNANPFLIWVYENSPCSMCRCSAATDMHEAGILPEEYREEMRWDVEYDHFRECIKRVES